MENNIKRTQKFFTQKKYPTLLFVGIGLIVLGLLLHEFGRFIFYRISWFVVFAGVVSLIISKSQTVSDSEVDLLQTELLREMEKEAYGCFDFTKSETEQERHPASGFDFTKAEATAKKGKEGKIYSRYVFASCLTFTNHRLCYGIKEFDAFSENSAENPKLSIKTFPLENIIGMSFVREELDKDGITPVMAYVEIKLINGETHKLLMQDDSNIETLAEKLDIRFKKNIPTA